jgi:hypothetical protein
MVAETSAWLQTAPTPPPPPPPGEYTVSQNVVGGGGAVSGTYGWQATPSDVAATAKVEFLVDGVLKLTDPASPYQHSLDTTTLSDGDHTWTVKAYATDGRFAQDDETVTVDNGTVEPPPPPPPTGQIILAWDRYADVPAKYGSNNPYIRVKDITLPVMPPGITTCMEILVDGSDSTSSTGDGTYLLNGGGAPESWITEGAETWESFWMAVPNGTDSRFPGTWRHSTAGSGWNTFYEYHEPGIAPVSSHLGAWGSDPPVWHATVSGGNPSSPNQIWVHCEQMRFNVWQFHLVHWKWSRQNAGYCEWWIDGRQQLGRTTPNQGYGNPNLPPGPQICDNYPNAWNVSGVTKGGYVELGHYRGPSRTDVEKTYVAKFRIGTTKESVGG